MPQAFADTGAFNERLRGTVTSSSLTAWSRRRPPPPSTGRARGRSSPTGPTCETKEYLGGFWVIEAADLDVALALAAEGSKACRGPVEVRPFRTAESVQALLEP